MQTNTSNLKQGHAYLLHLIKTHILVISMATVGGCSVYMAAHQPDKKNLNVFEPGTPRNLVLAEIGQPKATEMRNGRRVDVFSFVQGYSKGAKAGRAAFHGAADVLTLGLWEVVGTPTEATFDGSKVAFEVTYDKNDKVKKVVQLINNGKDVEPRAAQKGEGQSTATAAATQNQGAPEQASTAESPK